MNIDTFKNVINKMLKIIYLKYMYKMDLTLNNLQWLICLKTQPPTHRLNLYTSTYGNEAENTGLL